MQRSLQNHKDIQFERFIDSLDMSIDVSIKCRFDLYGFHELCKTCKYNCKVAGTSISTNTKFNCVKRRN